MRTAIAAVMAGVLAMTPAASAAAGRRTLAVAPYCGLTWGSGAKTGGALRTPSLVRVTTAKQTCWDQITFEFDGPVDGYSVEYADTVPTEGQGLDLAPFTAGGVHLAVSLRAPANSPTYSPAVGTHTVTAPGIVTSRTLRDAVYGGSFEGYTTFAVGVRARLPFRVVVVAGPGTHSQIRIDIAHLW